LLVLLFLSYLKYCCIDIFLYFFIFAIFFFLAAVSNPALGPTHSPIQWVPRGFKPDLKWLGREPDHSHPSIAEVKNEWSYTSSPLECLNGVVLVKHRDNFTFT
jgi:hypothetical protein